MTFPDQYNLPVRCTVCNWDLWLRAQMRNGLHTRQWSWWKTDIIYAGLGSDSEPIWYGSPRPNEAESLILTYPLPSVRGVISFNVARYAKPLTCLRSAQSNYEVYEESPSHYQTYPHASILDSRWTCMSLEELYIYVSNFRLSLALRLGDKRTLRYRWWLCRLSIHEDTGQ